MITASVCGTCDSCEETLSGLDAKIIGISDNRLYNIRYELNREVDYGMFALYSFYKRVLGDICSGSDCDCYGEQADKDRIIERIKILTA